MWELNSLCDEPSNSVKASWYNKLTRRHTHTEQSQTLPVSVRVHYLYYLEITHLTTSSSLSLSNVSFGATGTATMSLWFLDQ